MDVRFVWISLLVPVAPREETAWRKPSASSAIITIRFSEVGVTREDQIQIRIAAGDQWDKRLPVNKSICDLTHGDFLIMFVCRFQFDHCVHQRFGDILPLWTPKQPFGFVIFCLPF